MAAACRATLSLSLMCRTLCQACECNESSSRACIFVARSTQLKPQSVRDIFRTKNTPLRRDTVWSLKARARLGGDGDVPPNETAIGEDFYSVLGLTPDATQREIKKAYYSCMKTCHPDLSGNNSRESTDFCIFVNEIYEVLSDPDQRMVYDEINGYALTSGCKNCVNVAPDTFEIEEEFGRARVHCQLRDVRSAQEAIDTCPVDCIHWVTAAQLTLLEDEMRRIERVNVGLMLSGMGCRSPDVFAQASWSWEKRQAQALERARIQILREKGKDAARPWWQGWSNFGGDEDFRPDDLGARERAAKTAAASRRWREYSRQNSVLRKSTQTLSSNSGTRDEIKEPAFK